MNYMRLNQLLFSVLILTSTLGVAQDDPSPKPLQPRFDLLTLNPATGNATLSWVAPGYNPLNPEPVGYIIYTEYAGGGWQKIDSVDANTFTYTDLVNSGLDKSIIYRIASKGPGEPSPLTPPHGSIHVTAQYDSCGNKIDINWNHYVGWGNRIEHYNIYIGNNTNWQQFPVEITTDGIHNMTHYKVLPNSDYYIYVEAKKRDEELYTLSNLTHINTRVSRPPQFMYVDSLIAKDQRNEIYFSLDPQTEYKNFMLTRWEYSDSIASIFTAKTIAEFYSPSATYMADTSDSWSARSRPFFYRINAYDGCNRLQRVSNLSNTVTIRAYSEGSSPKISWESFYSSENNPIRYRLYRVSFKDEQRLTELIYEVENPFNNEFTDDLTIFDGQGYMPNFCYYIEAHEVLNIPGKSRMSRSRTLCTQVDPEITMPNALDPLSTIVRNGKPRNLFEPTISFQMPYKLTIFSRGGTIVFEGHNQGWDGRMPNGQLAPEGTYVYRLEVISESQKIKSQTSTVVVVYGPQ